jgi:hypothetical protein
MSQKCYFLTGAAEVTNAQRSLVSDSMLLRIIQTWRNHQASHFPNSHSLGPLPKGIIHDLATKLHYDAPLQINLRNYIRVSAHMKPNCTGYEYRKRNCVLRLFCDLATVCMVPLSSLVLSGSRTYFKDRS